MRKTKFTNNEYYHIYNRGVDKRDVFCDKEDYLRFLESIREFNNIEATISLRTRNDLRSRGLITGAKPLQNLVEFICYCLNSNHFHFILKQLIDGGISEFMKRLSGGYTCYFNQKYDRSGSLFQGTFKAVHIDNNEYLLWLSGYVNGNPEIHKISKAGNYKWCSYSDYLGLRNVNLCKKEIILSQFKNLEEYKKFVDMVIRESGKRKDLEKYFIENRG
jgi:putative transposase